MCRYCEDNEPIIEGETEDVRETVVIVNSFGNYELKLFSRFPQYDYNQSVSISYCPFCGRALR